MKQVNELIYRDYLEHPIWGFADDDGDDVEPVDYRGSIILADSGSLFILCKFTLQDGTEIPGAISVHMPSQRVYVLKFPGTDGKFFYFPVGTSMEGSVTREQLAAHLHKSIDEIFPITYTTPYTFKNGQPLIGRIQ